MDKEFAICNVTIDENYQSIFSIETFPMYTNGAMELTNQIDALNFRLRESRAGYKSDWHVAGDPTLIIVQRGIVRIYLRDETFKEFRSGDMFIAKDFLPTEVSFDKETHGHRAELIGEENFTAVHIKLGLQSK